MSALAAILEAAGLPDGTTSYALGTWLLQDSKGDERDRILIDNMRCNRWPVVVENTNSLKITRPFEERDVLLTAKGDVSCRGNVPWLVEYRARKIAERERELEAMMKEHSKHG